MFFLAGVNVHIIFTAVFADNLAFVNLFARNNEHSAAFLCVADAVRSGFTGFKSNKAAAGTTRNIAFIRRIACKHVVHNAVAFGIG